MSLSDLAALGSFVSGFAVLVSLVFLYFQLRQISAQVLQGERNQQASIRAIRVSRIIDIFLALAEPSIADAVSKVGAGSPDVSDSQIRQFNFYCSARFRNAEDSFYQYREGLLNQVAFDSLVLGLHDSFEQPGMRAFYKRSRRIFGKEFAEFLDNLLAQTPVARGGDPAADWRTAVAAELAAT
jgi:hypothetical protein